MIDSISISNFSLLQDESLKLLTGVFGVSKAASYMVDGRSNLYDIKNDMVQLGMYREYLEHYQLYDPLHPSKLTDQKVTIQCVNEFVSTVERQQSPYINEFMARWGIMDTVEIFLHAEGRVAMGFSLFLEDGHKGLVSEDMKKLIKICRFMQFSMESHLSSNSQKTFSVICERYMLTAKERLVAEQVMKGLPNKKIASNLYCALPTVNTHLRHIFQKMNVNSKAEVARLLYVNS